MDEFIGFKPQDAILPGYIRFSVTKKAFSDLSCNAEEAIRRLAAFSRSQVLLFTGGKDKDIYEVFTDSGIYLCRIADDNNAMLIMGFHDNNLIKQNNALKNGICFRVSAGMIIQIRLTQPYELFFDIENGIPYHDNSRSGISSAASLEMIAGKIKSTGPEDRDEASADEEYQPEKKFLSLLQTAESYSILAGELQEKTANSIGNIPYTSIAPAEYGRIDRVAYQFGIVQIDENVFKAGTQVEVEDRNQERHSAEIIELVKRDQDSPAAAVKLLFTEHIDISEFNRSGWFSLSFSDVNKDVQLTANEKLRTGEAPAKYMDSVFGRGETAGFDNCDLSRLKAALSERKFPPNQSQMDAVFSGIRARDVFLVMGPPGTGKTTVILEWVRYFVSHGKRVLVSSQNNKAVDNVLARIADDKDVDIIRIGSESKLQADIIPYMFENKVAALRSNISANSEQKIRHIDSIIGTWENYYTEVSGMADAVYAAKESRKRFNDTVLQEFLPLYRKLNGLYKEYTDIRESKKVHILSIGRLKESIDKYENKSSRIRQMLTYIFYKRDLRSMHEEVSDLDRVMRREAAVANEYNTLRGEYTKRYTHLRNVDFADLLLALRNEKMALERGKAFPERQEYNIWGLFDECRNVSMKNLSDCIYELKLIEADMDRARKLRSTILMWKQETDSRQNYALNEIVLESVDLVGATCIGINSQKRFANLDFDVTIIDEAGQIQVHNALVPMSVSNKLIMLGDHMQIPPSADPELMSLCEENGVKTDLLSMSLFEKMYYDLPEDNKIMLDTQYRMPGEIADTISEWFYGGKYYSSEFRRNLRSMLPRLSSCPFVIIDTSNEKNRNERRIEGAGCDNALEARIVTRIISVMTDDPGNDMREVGVISAYKSQVRLMKSSLCSFLPQEAVNEMAATLDSFQGQERDLILYSFTRSSNDPPAKRRIGFLNELRRLNVAMTRCRKMLVLIGDMDFLMGCRYCDKDDDGNPIYDKSERQFGDFIRKTVNDVKAGRGELIPYAEFEQRMG